MLHLTTPARRRLSNPISLRSLWSTHYPARSFPLRLPPSLLKADCTYGHQNAQAFHTTPSGLLTATDHNRSRKSSGSAKSPSRSKAQITRGKAQSKENVPLRDEAYIRQNMQVPTATELPDLPKELFETPKKVLNDVHQGIGRFNSDYDHVHRGFKCSLSYKTPAHQIDVDGEGLTKLSAEKAAYLHFLARCHELEILAEISDRNSPTHTMNKDVKKKQAQDKKDSVIDMFNYAARYDTMPQIKTSSIIHGHEGRRRRVYETIVTVQDFGVEVVGHGLDAQASEIDAALKFKAEAEKYQASKGKSSLVIKDFQAPTVDDAERFKEFMQIIRPGINIEVKMESGDRVTARFRAYVNDAAMGEELQMTRGKKAETIALLSACIALKKEDPALWPRYLRALQYGNGQILKPIAPMDMPVDEDCSLLMRETLLGARRIGLPDEVADVTPLQLVSDGRKDVNLRRLAPERAEGRNETLSRRLDELQTSDKFEERRRQKAELPINQYRSDVLNLVNNNEYSIVVGATGSGKTTQVPQILFDDAISAGNGSDCNVICTQPRRIAATSVARRVAVERNENLQWSVGYIVRFDPKPPKVSGGMCYCTTGILLQQLQHTPDELMDHASHLVIDEVHERDVLIDFLLILLKKNMARRKLLNKRNPKVVLMSATMDTELFANYFGKDESDGTVSACPSIDVPGRMFPVKERYLDEIMDEIKEARTPATALYADDKTRDYLDFEKGFQQDQRSFGQLSMSDNAQDVDNKTSTSVIDWRRESEEGSDYRKSRGADRDTSLIPYGLITTTIAHIARTTKEGAILVFFPGLEEIIRVDDELSNPRTFGIDFNDRTRYQRYILHSSVADTQRNVFDAVPVGCRKIILATNIAETSVTIPDVQHVVDVGKLREKQYDQERRITSLVTTWVSKSNSRQRCGRAGRVQDGNYYALFTRERAQSFRAIGLPELLRTDLQEVCLDIKAQAFQEPIRDFLAEAIEPPGRKNVEASVYNLQALDALTETEEITALGQLLANLPVHPSLGKMIILGAIFRCLDPMLILGAAGSQRSIFLNPLNERATAKARRQGFAQSSQSDHIAILNAVRELRHWKNLHGEQGMRDCARYQFLHVGAFMVIDSTASQIETILTDAGIIPFTPPHERHQFQYGSPALNENSHKNPLIKALLLAGLHPNIAVSPYGGSLYRTPNEKNVLVHPSSLNAEPIRSRSSKEKTERKPPSYYSYTNLAKSNDGHSMFIRDTSEITPLISCLFGGRLGRNRQRPNVLEMDDWLPFYILSQDRRTAKTVLEFRKGLERLLMSTFRDLENVAKTRRIGQDPSELEKAYLADDEVRKYFAAGLVEVLERDISKLERSKQPKSTQRDSSGDAKSLHG